MTHLNGACSPSLPRLSNNKKPHIFLKNYHYSTEFKLKHSIAGQSPKSYGEKISAYFNHSLLNFQLLIRSPD